MSEAEFAAMLVHIFPAVAVLSAIFAFIGGMAWGVVDAVKRHRTVDAKRPKFERVTHVETKIYEDDEL